MPGKSPSPSTRTVTTHSENTMAVAGLVLAGGKSSRFGSNKAFAEIDGTALIQRVADLFAGLFSHTLLSTNTPELYRHLGLPMVADRYPGDGPLAGIHAAMSDTRHQWLLVVACDMPLLRKSFLQCMMKKAVASSVDAIVPRVNGRAEPLCALYHRRTLSVAGEMLENKERRMHEFLSRITVRFLDDDELGDWGRVPGLFHNVNRPEDLALARALAPGNAGGQL